MNAPFPLPTLTPELEIDALLGDLMDRQSKRRIITAWRAGRITQDHAVTLLLECGLEGVE